MTCADHRSLLSARLDGALDPGRESALRDHLLTCSECALELEELTAVVELVRELPEPRLPQGLAADVLARLPVRGSARGPGRLLLLAPIAVAACLLVVLYLGSPPENRPEGERVAAGSDLPEGGEGLRDGLPAPSGPPGAKARSAAEIGSPPRQYRVVGVEPDLAAGRILAELDHLRRRRPEEASPRDDDANCEEQIVAGRSGAPSELLLCLTLREERLLADLFRGQEGGWLQSPTAATFDRDSVRAPGRQPVRVVLTR